MNELEHHGVKGMKWGVRRYQNYDGTYTQRGVARYRKHETEYEAAKNKRKSATTREQKKAAKGEMKVAKRQMKSAYKKLKTDKLADQGKELYKRGKTITGNSQLRVVTQVGINIGRSTLTTVLNNSRYAGTPVANVAPTVIAAGATIVNAFLAGKTYDENRKLRAYYAH